MSATEAIFTAIADEIVTPTMVKQYHSSERARTATKALGALMEVMSPLSPGLFCRVRNYLMVSLCLQNANGGASFQS